MYKYSNALCCENVFGTVTYNRYVLDQSVVTNRIIFRRHKFISPQYFETLNFARFFLSITWHENQ